MEVFTGLEASPLLVRSLPLKTFRDMKVLNDVRLRRIVEVGSLQKTLEAVQKKAARNNQRTRTRVEEIHNVQAKVLPINIRIG